MSVSNYDELLVHSGHQVECVTYGKGDVVVGFDGSTHHQETWNVAIECVDCSEVLLDFDHPEVAAGQPE